MNKVKLVGDTIMFKSSSVDFRDHLNHHLMLESLQNAIGGKKMQHAQNVRPKTYVGYSGNVSKLSSNIY